MRGREGRAPARRSPTWPTRPAPAARPGGRSPAVARARSRPRSCATARRPRSTRSTGWSDAFGRDRVLVELWDHGDPMDRPRNDALARIAARTGVEVVATNNVHYATPDRHRLADRARGDPQPAQPRRARRVAARPPRSRTCAARPSSSGASPAIPARSSARRRSRAACAFDLRIAVPNLPDYPVPGRPHRHDLVARAHRGAARRCTTRRPTRSTRRRCARSTTSSA